MTNYVHHGRGREDLVGLAEHIYHDIHHCGSEDIKTLWYDKSNNILIDEDGFVVHDIFEYITPNELALFKLKEEWMLIRNIELVWPDDKRSIFHTY